MDARSLQSYSPLMSQVDTTLRTFGVDLKTSLASLDFKTAGVAALVAVVAIVVVKVVGMLLAGSKLKEILAGLVTSAAQVWDDRDYLGLNQVFPYASRSLEPLSNVLDQLSSAAKKWEDLEVVQDPIFPTHPRERTIGAAI